MDIIAEYMEYVKFRQREDWNLVKVPQKMLVVGAIQHG